MFVEFKYVCIFDHVKQKQLIEMELQELDPKIVKSWYVFGNVLRIELHETYTVTYEEENYLKTSIRIKTENRNKWIEVPHNGKWGHVVLKFFSFSNDDKKEFDKNNIQPIQSWIDFLFKKYGFTRENAKDAITYLAYKTGLDWYWMTEATPTEDGWTIPQKKYVKGDLKRFINNVKKA